MCIILLPGKYGPSLSDQYDGGRGGATTHLARGSESEAGWAGGGGGVICDMEIGVCLHKRYIVPLLWL